MADKEQPSLTKQEAINQGYTLCGFPHLGYQNLRDIDEITEFDFSCGEITLAEKNGESPITNADEIRDALADLIESRWGNDTGDDTEEVYKTITKLDFEATATMINKALEHKHYTKLTDIILKP